MPPPSPKVYLILGIPGSGRREVLYDLIEGGVPAGEEVLFFHPRDEQPSPYDEQIEALDNVRGVSCALETEKITHDSITRAPEHIFFLAPGTGDPVAMVEALKKWLDHNQCRIGRILTVVHCDFFAETPEALPWIDACLHFSDISLLNRRENVSNRWIRDFQNRFQKERLPLLFYFVKKGRVPNPPAVLDPEARRVSLYFDELPEIDEDKPAAGEEPPDDAGPDPYVARLENGQRKRPVPDIRKFL